MTKRLAILQSNYIPWKGYFDLIAAVDEFVIYDDRQYTRNDWRNRNLIKTEQGVQWLTIPVLRRAGQRIDEARIEDSRWARRHWSSLSHAYGRTPGFAALRDSFSAVYEACAEESLLARVNRRLIDAVCASLGIGTRITSVADYPVDGERTVRLVEICRAAGAATYLSGPSARAYLDETAFERAGIAVEWADYDGYPEYPQVHPPFVHEVTILDLLFNTGADASSYMKAAAGAR